jgi:hypothetical protein
MPTEKLVYKSGTWVLYYGSTADVFTPVNVGPVAAASITRYSGDDSYRIDVDASQSFDSDGTVTLYSVDFGNGAVVTRTTPIFNNFVYGAAGNYTVTVTVTDDDGATDTWSQNITITAPVVVTPPPSGSYTPFTIRQVKPTADNTGSGLIRPVSGSVVTIPASGSGTLSYGTYTNGVLKLSADLKDTYVKCKSINVNGHLLENCTVESYIAMTSSDGLAWPVYSQNTASVIRFNTVFTTTTSPYSNTTGGVGTWEYNDLSRGVDGFSPFGTGLCTVRGNYIHDLQFYAPDPAHSGVVSAPGSPQDGKVWTHNDGVQMNATGVDLVLYGNNINAHWANDVGIQPIPTQWFQLACLMCNNSKSMVVEDNWFDYGQAVVNALGFSTGTLSLRRNKFGRHSNYGNAVIVIGASSSSRVTTFDGTSDQNIYEDNGAAVVVRRSA